MLAEVILESVHVTLDISLPDISITPEFLDLVVLLSGEIDTSQIITISNSGGSDLYFEIEILEEESEESDEEVCQCGYVDD